MYLEKQVASSAGEIPAFASYRFHCGFGACFNGHQGALILGMTAKDSSAFLKY